MHHPKLVGPSFRFGAHPSPKNYRMLRFEDYITGNPTRLPRLQPKKISHKHTVTVPTPAITIRTPGKQVVGVAFTIDGTYVGTAPSKLGYSVNGGAVVVINNAIISGGNWSTSVILANAGTYTITIQEASNSSVHATSGAFTVTAAPVQLPAPPASVDQLARVFTNLGLAGTNADIANLFPMDGNDTYGDCVVAAIAHGMTVWHGLLDVESVMASDDVLNLYFQLTGGVDSGLDMATTLNWWEKNSINGDEILTYVSVNPTNHTQVQQAIELFGGVDIALQVTTETVPQFYSQTPWTPAPLTNEGHSVFVTGYNADYVKCLTWGATQLGTWAWWNQCVTECCAILPPEAETAGFTQGFDFTSLQADIKDV